MTGNGIASSVEELIGDTPLVKLTHISAATGAQASKRSAQRTQ